mmetsp:Transcript_27758/g.43326  ORF Transcript_27758/g.43326 Transcript_27758/m.43326 type:complete len:96 (+) Transcript_27758:1409-1696(+)
MQQATERLISQLTVTVQITEALFAQISSLKGCVADSESGIFLKQSMYLAARLVEEKGASEDAQQTIRKISLIAGYFGGKGRQDRGFEPQTCSTCL